MRTNCPNCGAPITPNAKCEYCGTYFLDIARIPLHEPFYLSLNIGTEEHPQVITEKVYTSGCKLTREPMYDCSPGRDFEGNICRFLSKTLSKYEFEFVAY